MRRHEHRVAQALIKDDVRHGQKQRRVGARLDGHPLIGFRRRGGEMRVDDDHIRPGLLRLEEQTHLRQAGFAEIAADSQHESRIHPIARFGGRHGIASAKPDGRIKSVSGTHVDTCVTARLGAEHGGQKRKVRLT